MHPLLGVALSLLPALIELVAEDKSNALAVQAGDLVASATGAADEAGACERLLDRALARTLTVRLTELALTAQKSRAAVAEAAGQMQRETVASMQRQLSTLLAHAPGPAYTTPAPGPAAKPPARLTPSNFLPCLHEVLVLEGGYSDDPRDPGGPTNFGVTRAEWADVCKVPISSVTPEDMQKLTLQQAAGVYRKFYWNAMCCEHMAPGVDLMVFQFGVNAGIDASAKVLQQICGAAEDGVIGPLTLAAARRLPPVQLIDSLAERQLDRYRTFAEWDVYGRGWTNRVESARRVALSMAG